VWEIFLFLRARAFEKKKLKIGHERKKEAKRRNPLLLLLIHNIYEQIKTERKKEHLAGESRGESFMNDDDSCCSFFFNSCVSRAPRVFDFPSLQAYNPKNTNAFFTQYASRHADSATDIAETSSNWVDIIRRNLDMCLKRQQRRAMFYRKLHIKASLRNMPSLRNTPGFHAVHRPAEASVAGLQPASPEEAAPNAGLRDSPTSQTSLQGVLLEQHESARHEELTRERVRRAALDSTSSASGNMKILLSEPRAPRDAEALARLHALTGLPSVNPRDEDARLVVAKCAEEVRSSILFRSRQ